MSPVEQEHQSKKPNKGVENMDKDMVPRQQGRKSDSITDNVDMKNIKDLLIPLMEKVDKLRETVDNKYSKLGDAITIQKREVSKEIHKLDEAITIQREELKDSLSHQIQESNTKVQQMVNENAALRQENQSLKEWLDKLESAQLTNNAIIMGIPEQQWESYALTKQRVYDTIAASKGSSNDPEWLNEAKKVEISYCTRIGKYRPNIS